ncbi:cell division protein FtsQ/DivIB [Prescottella subtropica]|uniref:cell division protein FtsQ/DivIB n=1 Tax=Prescottella subtropica TaxID=2545757 RepID=UPI0010F71EB7|nr:FtsQ-type POTRA domain-containing protein [Prescottella subtropica]
MTVDGRDRSRRRRPDARRDRGARVRTPSRERAEPPAGPDGPGESDGAGRGSAARARARALRRKVVLIAGAAGTVLVVAVGALWFSPLMSVRSVVYSGDGVVTEEEALGVLAVAEGTPLLRVDTAAAAQRVAGIPRVAEARVQRAYPSTIRLTVVERVPVVFFDSPEGPHLLDAGGVDYAVEPPPFGVPRLVTPAPGHDDHATQAALAVLAALPESIRFQVSEVVAPTMSSVSVTLGDGRVVVWGSADNSERKSAVVSVLLTQPGRTFDVSSPELPTVK